MKLEFLVLVKNDDSFCNSKRAFIDFLKVDSLISVSRQKLSYKRTAKSKNLLTVNFRVETGNVPSNKERFFHVVLENKNEDLVDEFSELGDKIKQIAKRINPESTVINMLWDDVGRHYAYMSYPMINEIENIMRKLISKFMLINVGMDWSKDNIHSDLAKKIGKYEEEDAYLNDLYKLDFIHLSQMLFQKKRDISLDELDKLLLKTKFNENDQTKILKYIPRSNWEKYFSTLFGEDTQGLETKWEILYKLRNKVAHNRFLKKQDFKKIEGLTRDVKKILSVAINKLGEIDLEEEDRELIIHSYNSESPMVIGYLTEKSVMEYYLNNGYALEEAQNKSIYAADLIVSKGGEKVAVEVKSIRERMISSIINRRFDKIVINLQQVMASEGIEKAEIVMVIRGYDENQRSKYFKEKITMIRASLDPRISLKVGYTTETDEFEPIDV